MKLILSLGALLMAVAPLASAYAADVATIGCVHEGLEPETINGIKASAKALLSDDGRAALDPALLDKLKAAGKGCAARFGWSDNAVQAAVTYTKTVIGISAAESVVSADGTDPAKVRAFFRALPDSAQLSFGSGKAPSEMLDALRALLKKLNISPTDTDHGGHVLSLCIFTANADRLHAAFASS